MLYTLYSKSSSWKRCDLQTEQKKWIHQVQRPIIPFRDSFSVHSILGWQIMITVRHNVTEQMNVCNQGAVHAIDLHATILIMRDKISKIGYLTPIR